jgi:uncharacterized membrane protein YadS
MSIGIIEQTIDIWVTQYAVLFCLLTIVAWGGSAFFLVSNWMKPLRDSVVYLLAIGLLALALSVRPNKLDSELWSPFCWFCFAMLMVLELLWISYLLESLLKLLHTLPARLSQSGTHPRK